MKRTTIPLTLSIVFTLLTIFVGIVFGSDGDETLYFIPILLGGIAIASIVATFVAAFSKGRVVVFYLLIVSLVSLICSLVLLILSLEGTGIDESMIISAITAGIAVVTFVIMIIVSCVHPKPSNITPNPNIESGDYCPYCGIKMAMSDALFCTKCGKKIK